jgi:ribosomal protein L37AE/L43A
MNRNRLTAAFVLGVFGIVFALAQGPGVDKADPTRNPNAKPPMKRDLYACPKCEAASTMSGNCKGCGEKMVKIQGTTIYACPDCHKSGMKPGKCPACGMAMKKMVRTYACHDCKVSSTKPGKCSKCGMALKKHLLPLS